MIINDSAMKIKTGIYSGSFNPVHIGHLALANWLCEYTELDELWFMITPHNPLKNKDDLFDDHLRLNWVKAAIAGYPKFKASDFEFSLPQPTYTITTLRKLRETHTDRSFHLIMGADNWKHIHQWKDSDMLLNEFPILVYPRKGYSIDIPEKYKQVKAVNSPIIEISSSFIRESVKKGKDVRFFLPQTLQSIDFTNL